MTGFAALYRKELRVFFATPVAYAAMAVFWALTGYYFSFNVFFVNVAQMVNAFHNMSLLLMLMVPLLSMRSFAEENRTGTAELLLTLPVDESAIVLGKFAAAMTVVGLMIAGTATALVPLVLFGQPDLGPVFGGYLGVLLLGAAFLAIGTLVSALCSNQFVAALVTWGILVLLWYIDYFSALQVSFFAARVVRHLSFSFHYVDLIRGVIPATAVVYFLGMVLVTLVTTVQVLKSRRI